VDEDAWEFLGWSVGSVGDPTAKGLDFGGVKWRPVVRHPFDTWMGSFQDLYQQAFGGFSGDDCWSRFSAFQGVRCGVEAEFSLWGFDGLEVVGLGGIQLAHRDQDASGQESKETMGESGRHGDRL
jgi:hypothetical protein